MSTSSKEWLKREQKTLSYYLFEDKQVIGEKFFNALLKKRTNGFYIDDDTHKEGFVASLYGVYELLSVADNFFNENTQKAGAFFKNIPADVQLSLANEIKSIYEHIDKFGFDFAPVISNHTNERFFLVTEEAGSKNVRQKYPYFGAMTWVLSLSSLLWKKYFAHTETGIVKQIDYKQEIISDPESVKIIRDLEQIIKDTIRHIIRLFATTYISPKELSKIDFHAYGDDNKELKMIAAEDGLKLGWGYTKGVKVPSLYFTFSILEAYSDFDSNILIGGDKDDYFFPTEEETEKGMEITKNESAYARSERFYNNLIDYINSDVKRDDGGNIVMGSDGKPERVFVKGLRYEEEFRKAATQCAYYLFYKFKDTISDSFYNDDGYVVTKQQILLSSTSPSVFYPLYILSSLLNGEVNGTIKTKLMYTKRYRNQLVSIESRDKDTLDLITKADKQIKDLESEYRQFEGCFTDGLNNVQKLYSFMEKSDKLDVIDRHYLTFDQTHSENSQFSRMLSRENVLAMPLLPLLVNVTNLYVLWITKFPDKQISAYIMDVFENYCNHNEDGTLEWVFEQGNYDLHATIRYIDAISNFFNYYETYEKAYAVRSKDSSDAKAAARAEIQRLYNEKYEKSQLEHNRQIDALNRKISDLNRELADSDNKYTKVFNVENSTLMRLSEIFNQYVACAHSGKVSPHSEAIDAFFKAILRVAVLKLSNNADASDKYQDELKRGLNFLFDKRGESVDNSLASLFKNIIEQDTYIFLDMGTTKSDQD